MENTSPETPASPTIFFDDKKIRLDELPKPIKDLFDLHAKWNVELSNARVEVFKLEAAIRGLNEEIEHRLRNLSNTEEDHPNPSAR